MHYLEKRLQEIDQRLGAITADLGLTPKMEVINRQYHLFFQKVDDSGNIYRSTVSFIFEPPARTGEAEVSWDNVKLGLCESSMIAVGSNGWVHYLGDYDYQGYTIGKGEYIETWERAFELAADGLRRYPLVPQGLGYPFILDDGEMGDLWVKLEPICLERGIDDVYVGRDDERWEFFEFDYAGARFQLIDRGFEIDLCKDGETCDVITKFKFMDVTEIIDTQLSAAASSCKDI
ncbi:hypothetical protein QTL95_18290 [Rhizobium sp. S152]|uniref:hypothetical protein n=1 Tax=Rhizobium sp. S152 TaxID=3055038 RepID=UPI0025A975D4|nr:hypothetical protein [Rhizobium sp. S152]MDM9627844.1 hypothetical protein [Rhizobium sp. S152]